MIIAIIAAVIVASMFCYISKGSRRWRYPRVNIEPCGFQVLFYSNSRTNDLCLKNAGKGVDVLKGAFYGPPLP
jgi:hypothetical protein